MKETGMKFIKDTVENLGMGSVGTMNKPGRYYLGTGEKSCKGHCKKIKRSCKVAWEELVGSIGDEIRS